MFRILKKILLLSILTSLRIALILGSSVLSSFLRICKVYLDIFNLPAQHLSNESPTTEENSTQTVPHCSNPRISASVQTDDECIQTVPRFLEGLPSTGDISTRNIPHCCSSKTSTSVQTEEESSKQLGHFGSQSSTDIIIYNLNSSQKLVITPGKSKSNQCECCKAVAETATSEQTEIKAPLATGYHGSNSSNMSIESDVIDSKIETGCSSSLTSSDENASINAEFTRQSNQIQDSNNETSNADGNEGISFENINSTRLNSFNDTFNISSDFENFESDTANTFIKCEDPTLNKQKTSSPLNNVLHSPQNSCSNTSMFDVEQSQITKNKAIDIGTNLEPWERDSSGTSFKRRLSLPVKLTTNTAAINFKLAQKKLIEDALKNTSRHEKSFKEIKYPFSSEISLDGKSNDELDEKGVFSCSSYESLPVSDHLRNACSNNTLLSLYNETLNNEDSSDFSSLDNLVGACSEMKSNFSVPNVAQSKVILSKKSGIDGTKEKPDTINRTDDSNPIEDKNGATKLCSEINLSTSVTDMCNILDKFVSSEVKLSSNRILNFNDNSGDNKHSGINDSVRTHSATNDYKTSDNSILGHENEENELNPVKFKFSSPLKSVFSDPDEWSDEENSLPCIANNSVINKRDKHDNLKQSYLKIAFIDDSPPRETTRVNTNALNGYQAASLNEKPTFRNQNEKPSFRNQNEKSSSRNQNEKPSFRNQKEKPSFRNQNEKPSFRNQNENPTFRNQNENPTFRNQNDNFPFRSQNEKATPGVKTSMKSNVKTNESAEYCSSHLPIIQRGNLSPTNTISIGEARGNTSIGESAEASEIKQDRIIRVPRRNYRWRTSKTTLSKWTGDCENKVETSEVFYSSPLPGTLPHLSVEPIPTRNTEHTDQSILETKCQKHQSPPAEESTSSGDSTSDNSVVTVKDLQEMK